MAPTSDRTRAPARMFKLVPLEPEPLQESVLPKLGTSPDGLLERIVQSVSRHERCSRTIDRFAAEDRRRRAYAIVRAKLALLELPLVVGKTKGTVRRTPVYEIHLVNDIIETAPGLYDAPAHGKTPTPDQLRGAAWIVYHACAESGLDPEIHFRPDDLAGKGGQVISVAIPDPGAPLPEPRPTRLGELLDEPGFEPFLLYRKVAAEAARRDPERPFVYGCRDWNERIRRHAVARAKVVLDCLPLLIGSAAEVDARTADVYEIDPRHELVQMPGVNDTATASFKPLLDNLHGTAELVYRACAELRLRPEITYFFHERAGKAGYRIFVTVPYPRTSVP